MTTPDADLLRAVAAFWWRLRFWIYWRQTTGFNCGWSLARAAQETNEAELPTWQQSPAEAVISEWECWTP